VGSNPLHICKGFAPAVGVALAFVRAIASHLLRSVSRCFHVAKKTASPQSGSPFALNDARLLRFLLFLLVLVLLGGRRNLMLLSWCRRRRRRRALRLCRCGIVLWLRRCLCCVTWLLYRSSLPCGSWRGYWPVRSLRGTRSGYLSRGVSCRLCRTRSVTNRRTVLACWSLISVCRRHGLLRRSGHIFRWRSSALRECSRLICNRRFLLVYGRLVSHGRSSALLVYGRLSTARRRRRIGCPNISPNRWGQWHAVGFLQQRALLFKGHRTRWRSYFGSYLPRRDNMLRHIGRSAPAKYSPHRSRHPTHRSPRASSPPTCPRS